MAYISHFGCNAYAMMEMKLSRKYYTVKQKKEIAQKILKYDISIPDAALIFGISTASASVWVREYLKEHPGEYKSVELKKRKIEQLCWNCKNAVPDMEGTKGCSWSRNLIPVPDCVYEKGEKGESYIVQCPLFVLG